MTVADEREIPRRRPAGEAAEAGLIDRLQAYVASTPREVVIGLAILSALVALGGVLRLWDLGARPFHHDESLHGTYSWYFSEGRGYVHDPLMHGPFQFHITALTFVLFGDGDYQARFMAAIFGTALIAMAWLLRDRIGTVGAVALGLLIAFSPTLLYFSRFIREDIFVAVWTFGLVIAIWRYVDRRQARYLGIAAAMLALAFATKELTYITAGLFIIYFDLFAAWDLAEQTRDSRDWSPAKRALVTIAYAPAAWAIVALWPVLTDLRARLGFRERTPSCNVLLVLGTLTLPQFAALLGAPIENLGGWFADPAPGWFRPTPGLEGYIGVLTNGALFTVVGLLAATAAVGLSWNWRIWGMAAVIFYGIYFTLFTTFYSNDAGISSGIWGSLDYWIEQQDVRRGDQPFFYYLMLLPVYEFLPLAIALLAAIPLLMKGNAFTRFLLFWFAGLLVALSAAGEKMPWLTVHLALPLAVIAATGISWAVSNVRWPSFGGAGWQRRPVDSRVWALGGAALMFIAAMIFSTQSAVRASFGHNADGASPKEMLVYTQTSPELVQVYNMIKQHGEQTGQGRNVRVYIDSAEGLAWPWAWYFRDWPGVLYADMTGGNFDPPAGSVAVVYGANIIPFDQNPAKWRRATITSTEGKQQDAFTHRWWFPETYKATNSSNLLDRVTNPDTWQLWWNYFYDRTLPYELGRLHSVLYLPATGG